MSNIKKSSFDVIPEMLVGGLMRLLGGKRDFVADLSEHVKFPGYFINEDHRMAFIAE